MSSSVEQDVILIVDDNPTNLEVLFEMFKRSGFRVLVAVDGQSAVEQAEYAQPDMILLDVMMPELDGFETCRRLKQIDSLKEIPVIFMTALSETVDKVTGFQLGAVDYITKPLQHEEVLARVNAHLTLRKLQQELKEANDELEQRVATRTAELARANTRLRAEVTERNRAYDELNKTNQAYSRFVPTEFLQLLNQHRIIDVKLGDQRQMEMTILFADIRAFTSMSEQMTPQDNFNFINRYLRRVSPIIRQHGGFIDKYIGDGIMALFSGKPDDAVQAAIAMQKEIAQYNQQTEDNWQLRVGIGLHTGSIMLGIIGEEERMEGTVISDAVNQASRMEGLTKHYEAAIVFSDRTLTLLGQSDRYSYRFLDKVQVKGKTETVAVYEVFDGDAPQLIALKNQTKLDFEEALRRYYDRDFAGAKQSIERVLTLNPLDKAAALYRERINRYLMHGVTPGWTGVEELTEK